LPKPTIWERWRARRIAKQTRLPYEFVLAFLSGELIDKQVIERLEQVITERTGLTMEQLKRREKP
jgi:hypothetical protein